MYMYFHHFEKKIIVFTFRKYQAMKMIWKQVLKIKWVFKISILTKIPQLNWVIGLYKRISFGSCKINLYIYFISNGVFLIQVYQVKKHGEEERKSTTMLIAKKKTILVSILAYKNFYKQKNINIFLICLFL